MFTFFAAAKILQQPYCTRKTSMNKKGRFGIYGGQYITETLMNTLCELETAYGEAMGDQWLINCSYSEMVQLLILYCLKYISGVLLVILISVGCKDSLDSSH